MRKLIVFVGIASLALAGCGGGESSVIGKYKGEVKAAAGEKKDVGTAMGEGFANALASSMTLEIKADHTFSMTAMMFPVEGKWAMSGSELTLTPEKVMGMAATGANKDGGDNKPMKFTVSEGGKRLLPIADEAKKAGEPDISFVKQ